MRMAVGRVDHHHVGGRKIRIICGEIGTCAINVEDQPREDARPVKLDQTMIERARSCPDVYTALGVV